MSMNEVFAISNKPGEVNLKGFNYIRDRLPDDFEVCLIVEGRASKCRMLEHGGAVHQKWSTGDF